MRRPPLLLPLLPLLAGLAGCDRRKDDLHAGVVWAQRMLERAKNPRSPERVTLAGVLDQGGEPIHWLTASLPEKGAVNCCTREPKAWWVRVSSTPDGLVTVSGYGDDLSKPLESVQVQLEFGPPQPGP